MCAVTKKSISLSLTIKDTFALGVVEVGHSAIHHPPKIFVVHGGQH